MNATYPDQHEPWMRRALELAAMGEGHVEPNPMVGCVIVNHGRAIGEGFHRRFGEAHAEVDALRSLASPDDANGATAYVTLEPCCHHGKTPPCTDALIGAGVKSVVVALRDPFEKVSGGGLQALRDAGLDVVTGVMEEESRRLLAPYLKRVQQGMPWVIAKWAMTADGRTATASGESQWITNEQSRAAVHQLRGRVDGILVGMGTVTEDDPMLTARVADTAQPPRRARRIVLCRNRLPGANAKLVQTAHDVPTLLFISTKLVDEARKLEQFGVETIAIESNEPTEMVDEVLRELVTKHDMTNLMLEAGPTLMGSFVRPTESRIDECHVYVGSKVFGGDQAKSPIGGAGTASIASSPGLRLLSADRFGDDVRLIYRRAQR